MFEQHLEHLRFVFSSRKKFSNVLKVNPFLLCDLLFSHSKSIVKLYSFILILSSPSQPILLQIG